MVVVVRWLALGVGVGLSTLSFVRLVEEHDLAVGATPWWWVGLIGVAITVLALGSPWSRRSGRDDVPTRRGS